jgi:hypothetical protein
MVCHMSHDVQTVGNNCRVFHHLEEWMEWLSFDIYFLSMPNHQHIFTFMVATYPVMARGDLGSIRS